MLQKQHKTYEDLSVEFSKVPGDNKLEKDLRDCENLIKILEAELAAKTPAIDAHVQTTSSNITMLTGKEGAVYSDLLRLLLLSLNYNT